MREFFSELVGCGERSSEGPRLFGPTFEGRERRGGPGVRLAPCWLRTPADVITSTGANQTARCVAPMFSHAGTVNFALAATEYDRLSELKGRVPRPRSYQVSLRSPATTGSEVTRVTCTPHSAQSVLSMCESLRRPLQPRYSGSMRIVFRSLGDQNKSYSELAMSWSQGGQRWLANRVASTGRSQATGANWRYGMYNFAKASDICGNLRLRSLVSS